MTWAENDWYQCQVTNFDYVESPVKGTKAFELTCHHPEHGTVTGQWWLIDTPNSKGVPMWQAARERCIQLGCDEAKMNAAGWLGHIRSVLVGVTVSCMIGVERFEDTQGNQIEKAVAKFIGVPKSGGKSGYKQADARLSPFAAKMAGGGEIFTGVLNEKWVASDDDVPY